MAKDPKAPASSTTSFDLAHAGAEAPVRKKRAPRSGVAGAVKPKGKSGKVVVVKEQPPTTPLELRKAVEAITIRNMSSSGEITFLQRKAYNAMLQIAQKNRTSDEITFEVPISEFEDLVGHTTSNSREYLKNMARQLASIQVEFDFKGESPGRKTGKNGGWGVANMVAEVYISDDGQNIRFSFPPDLAKRLLDPEMYNRIDMRMQNLFTSYSALTLFETVSRYYGFSQKETFREHWTAWSVILSGSNTPHTQFRDFNKMLTRAIDQVNAHETRFKIVLHLSKRGRKMDKLWFVLEDQQQAQLPLGGSPTIVSDELMTRLRGFGLKDEEITAAAMQLDEEYLLAQADYTDKRIKKKTGDPVASPKAFFMSAVDKNYADAPRRPPRTSVEPPAQLSNTSAPKPDAKQALSSMKNAWRRAKREEIRERFHAQSEEKKKEIIAGIEDHLRKQTVAWQQYTKNGITKVVESSIIDLILEKNCPEPTAEELLQFALETGSLMAPAPTPPIDR
ncbi:RepB family plasmid replication initiator protein [Cupriavidus sp. TMH.W2]|uniref:RepB family plasmid replication initiator protein n=1 Tax=Cupriavidus sp. TMH.W2 TaxID=3434465 RepID=UPI003D784431